MRDKCLCLFAVAALAAGGTLLAGAGQQPGELELKKIQGTWRFVSHTIGDKPTAADQVAKMRITFAGDKWSVTENDKVVQAGTHKLDPTKKPAELVATVTDGERKGSKMLGIYELKGDTIRVCFDPEGKQRPTSFTATAGQLAAVIEREKKKP